MSLPSGKCRPRKGEPLAGVNSIASAAPLMHSKRGPLRSVALSVVFSPARAIVQKLVPPALRQLSAV
jgi:hypothetical protein